LHKTLKKIYILKDENSQIEKNIGPYIVDIINSKNEIIEIQTKNLGNLEKKCKYFIEQKQKIKIVHPIISTKYIETKRLDSQITRKKSPKKENIYSIFKELTKLYPYLLNKYFSLEIIDIDLTEIRQEQSEPIQSKNKNRRYKKNWNKVDKKLEKINKSYLFDHKKEYLKLLPITESKNFTFKDIYKIIKEKNKYTKEREIRYFFWILTKLELIEVIEKKGKQNIYKIKKPH
jgi:hypothetical protein